MSKNRNFKQFIGVDVSKKTLDICLLDSGKEYFYKIENNKKALKSLFSTLKKEHKTHLPSTLFCVENTGDYTNPILFFLSEISANIWMEMPIKIKQSSGLNRLKTDKTDAKMIASYAQRFQDKFQPWSKPRKEVVKLKKLFALREKLTQSISRYAAPKADLEFTQDKEVMKIQKRTYSKIIAMLKQEKEQIEKQIKEVIKTDKELSRLFKIVSSCPGIGFVAAIDIIINTNEFKNIDDPKKYACYSGIAPFEQSSGTSVFKKRVSHLANKNAKKANHMGAMSVVTSSDELKTYYYRKIAQGKSKMSALNAVRNKMILRVFACVKRNETYKIDFKPNF